MRQIWAVIFYLVATTPLLAQGLPDYDSTTINDFAELLSDADEARLDTRLSDLRAETGVEMVVVTITSRTAYPEVGGSLEGFATDLFNTWGIGDATRNDGILALIVRDDREMRLELGSGYARSFDRVARSVISDGFLPDFRAGNYAVGIFSGVDDTIARIVRPHLDTGVPLSGAAGGNGWLVRYLPIAIIAAVGALIAFRRRLADGVLKLRRCPKCGRRYLSRLRHIDHAATKTDPGQTTVIVSCSNCDYENRDVIRTSPLRSRGSGSGGSFGGGRSSGGGSSGRW